MDQVTQRMGTHLSNMLVTPRMGSPPGYLRVLTTETIAATTAGRTPTRTPNRNVRPGFTCILLALSVSKKPLSDVGLVGDSVQVEIERL